MLVLMAMVLIGLIAGLLSGLLGLGGGAIMVPALVFLFKYQGIPTADIMHLAIATSLGAMMFTTGMATWSHHKRKAVNWSLLKIFLPGTIWGAMIGVGVGRYISTHRLSQLFALVTIIIGIYMILFTKEKKHTNIRPLPIILFIFALLVGNLAGMIGIGGGIILIPIFLWLGLSMKEASANTVACAFPTVTTGALAAILIGWHIKGLPPMTLGYVYWPGAVIIGSVSVFSTHLGVHFAHRLPMMLSKRLFGILLLFIAWRMLAM